MVGRDYLYEPLRYEMSMSICSALKTKKIKWMERKVFVVRRGSLGRLYV